jgi:hypothetical protein
MGILKFLNYSSSRIRAGSGDRTLPDSCKEINSEALLLSGTIKDNIS